MERQLAISEARRQLAAIVDRVQHQNETYIVERHGRPAAALVPVKVLETWRHEREALFRAIREMQDANADADPDEVMREVLTAQQETRKEQAPPTTEQG